MDAYGGRAPFTPSGARFVDLAAGLEVLEGEVAGAGVFASEELERFDAFCVAALADAELGGLFEPHDGDAEHAHEEDEGARGEPDVAPAFVVGVRAGRGGGERGRVLAGVVWDEGPGEEAGDELADSCCSLR